MTDRPYNTIQVGLSNGGMDKEASVLIQQGRKVLELRSRYTTSFVGRLRHTWEAILWNGPALRSGLTIELEQRYARASLISQPEILDQVEQAIVSDPGIDDAIRQEWQAKVVAASRFTDDEYFLARRLT